MATAPKPTIRDSLNTMRAYLDGVSLIVRRAPLNAHYKVIR